MWKTPCPIHWVACPDGPIFRDLCTAHGRTADGTSWECAEQRAADRLCIGHRLARERGLTFEPLGDRLSM